MEGQEFKDLKSNIQKNGLVEPITIFEGKVLDGRNRHRACIAAGISVDTKEFKGTPIEAIERVWVLNKVRRHLNPSQAAIADAKKNRMAETYAPVREAAKERKAATIPAKGQKGFQSSSVSQLIGEHKQDPHDRTTDAVRAKAAGTNRTYIQLADKLVKDNPHLAEKVERGEQTLSQVARTLKKEEISKNAAPLPSGKYRVIYADPPWSYNDSLAISKKGLNESYGPADAHYPQMSITELCAMQITDIAADDSVLFLWTTSPLLEDAFRIIKAWGFAYKTSFVWDKIKHNMGHYNSVRHEFLLICTRGSCTPDAKKLFDSVQTIERSKMHSEKPGEFRKIIETLYTHGEKLELFGRKKHQGWTMHGNEV